MKALTRPCRCWRIRKYAPPSGCYTELIPESLPGKGSCGRVLLTLSKHCGKKNQKTSTESNLPGHVGSPPSHHFPRESELQTEILGRQEQHWGLGKSEIDDSIGCNHLAALIVFA